MNGQRQRHGRVQMGARDAAGHIAAEGDGHAPAEVDRQGVAEIPFAEHDLRDDADAEHDQGERA